MRTLRQTYKHMYIYIYMYAHLCIAKHSIMYIYTFIHTHARLLYYKREVFDYCKVDLKHSHYVSHKYV